MPYLKNRMPFSERLSKCEEELGRDACWLWPGFVGPRGYVQLVIYPHRKRVYAHRRAYELIRGPIPEGLTIDHLCNQPICFNPWHLEPVSIKENILRATHAPAYRNKTKTHCVRGHPLSGDNLVPRRPFRQCRECSNLKQRERWRRKHHQP